MTNCRSIQDKLLTEYIDGLLSAEELAETNRHLDSCTQCRNALATIRQAETTRRAAPVFTPPDHCWANIREQIEASVIPEPEPERPHPWNAWLEYLFGQPQHAAERTIEPGVQHRQRWGDGDEDAGEEFRHLHHRSPGEHVGLPHRARGTPGRNRRDGQEQ